MAKLKTNSAAKKRFRVASGKIKRAKAYRRHLLTKKTAKRKRGLRATAYVGTANIYAIKELLAHRV